MSLSVSEYFPKPKVFLFADADNVGLSIVNTLLSKMCKVLVVTSKGKEWKDNTQELSENNNFRIVEEVKNTNETEEYLSYLIYVDLNLKRSKADLDRAVSVSKNILGKKIFLLPLHVETKDNALKLSEIIQKINENIPDGQSIFVGDVIGKNISRDSLIYKVISAFFVKNAVLIDESKFFFLSARALTKVISDSIFSFGLTYDRYCVYEEEMSFKTLFDLLKNTNPNEKYYQVESQIKRYKVGDYYVEKLGYPVMSELKDTISWVKNNLPKPNTDNLYKSDYSKKKEEIKPYLKKIGFTENYKNDHVRWGSITSILNFNFDLVKKLKNLVENISFKDGLKGFSSKKIRTNNTKIKYILLALFILLIVYISPLVLFASSALAQYYSFRYLIQGREKLSNTLFDVGSNLNNASLYINNKLIRVPVYDEVLKDTKTYSLILKDGQKIFKQALFVYNLVKDIPQKIFSGEDYPVGSLSEKLFLDLDGMEKDLGFLQGEIESLNEKERLRIEKYLSLEKIVELKGYLKEGKIIAKNFGNIVGEKGQKSYLVLFQNNMELRPTGGFIGSFALITLENGKVVNMNIQDVYSADGQLKGHVDPPEPIRKYLGEGGWYLRDSNWDPDFVSSAQKVEWFLEKEIDQTVDGVVAIDLEVAKSLLKSMGEITLKDYQMTLDEKNMYQKIQSTVEEDFFPGSTKKASVLTAFAGELLNEITSKEEKNNATLIKNVFILMREKHIQLYVKNNTVQNALSSLNLSGEVKVKKCGGNCYFSNVSYVDANLGVNKNNLFIERSAILDQILTTGGVENILRIKYVFNKGSEIKIEDRYKTYVRVLISPKSEVRGVDLVVEGNKLDLEYDIFPGDNYSEVGALVEVYPNEEKTIEFKWVEKPDKNLDFSKPGQFGTYIRKQAGTMGDNISVRVYLPKEAVVGNNSFFSLTQSGSFVYNTTLTEDRFPVMFWK